MASLARGRRRRVDASIAAWAFAAAGIVTGFAAAGALAVDEALRRNDTERVDAGLARTLDAASRAFAARIADAGAQALALARSPALQTAVAERDRARASSVLRTAREPAAVYADRRLLAGDVPSTAISRSVVLRRGKGTAGSVRISVRLDRSLLRRLRPQPASDGAFDLALVSAGRLVAATRPLPQLPAKLPRQPAEIDVGGRSQRAVAAPLVRGARPVVLAAVAQPAAEHGRRRRIVFALATSIATLLLAASAAVTLTSARRSPADRRRHLGRRTRGPGGEDPREALALVGDALAATHDPEALLPVILNAAVEATGAVGGRLIQGGNEVAKVGWNDAGGQPLVVRLDDEPGGSELRLIPPPAGFSPEARELGRWLAAQAVIALENARLHGLVKTQATTDELTGLANRRRFMEVLALELRRAERFGSPLALVLADLDDFKLVNDRFGHAVGDNVLAAVGDVFLRVVRDIDLPTRLGGEEFAILLPETDLDGAGDLSERLRAAVEEIELTDPQGGPLRVTASFGVAVYPDGRSGDELLSAADAALYRAKGQGKNQVAIPADAG